MGAGLSSSDGSSDRGEAVAARQLQHSRSMPHDWSMDNLDSFLLYELRVGSRSPDELAVASGQWGCARTTSDVVEALQRLREQGFVDGPGISLMHHLRVWLTRSGELRARNAGDNLPGWPRVS
jgi:hypothetical protein